MDDEDDFINDELIAATSSVERELGFAFGTATSLIATQITESNESHHDDEVVILEENEPSQMPFFHCTGEDSSLSSFHKNSYVRSGFASTSIRENCIVETIFGLKISEYTIYTEELLPTLFQRARKNIQLLDMAVRDGSKSVGSKSFLQSRLDVTSLLFVLSKLSKTNSFERKFVIKGLDSLQKLIEPISKNSILNFAHLAHCITGNCSKSPEYHLLHGFLEWRLLRISILKNILKNQPNHQGKIDNEFQQIIFDLIQLSIAKYKHLKRVDLLYRTPFICTCVKELWLLVQLLIEKLHAENQSIDNPFWSFFNYALNMMQSKKDIHGTPCNEMPSIQQANGQQITNWPEFSAWLLSNVAKLQGYSMHGLLTGPQCLRITENFKLLNSTFRDFIADDPIEDALRTALFIVIPIICEWWTPKTDILLVLWEYFHKKLNSSFFLQGSAPSSLAKMSGSVIEYLNNLRNSIEAQSVNANETSFSMFIYMFGKVLKKLAKSDKAQINKIFGRITSKFSAPKLMALNETGIFNLTTLFLTIGLTTHLKDTARPLQTILLQMTLSKLPTNRQITLVRGHVALIVLFSRHQILTGPYIAKLLEQLGAINQDRVCLVTSKILADGFVEMFSNSQSYGMGQKLLIGPWLVKYLSASQYSEHQRIIACINLIITKISSTRFSLTPDESNHAKDMLKQIYQVFIPYTLQNFSKNESSREVAELSANLCLNGDLCNDISFNSKLLLKQFTDINSTNVENLAAFLVIIITADKEMFTDQALLIDKWIQCCMCFHNSNEDFNQLTNIVVLTNEFRSAYLADASEILHTREPLCMFFSEVGRLYETSDYHKRIEVSDKIHQYLSSFSSYASALLETPENTVKVFSMISIIIFHCAPIVYIKGRNSCFFNTIMFKFVLPNQVLTGRPQEPHLIIATHKVWHLLIMGIEKLDFEGDQHVVTILTNLIEKWISQFKSLPPKSNVAKPFINCLKQCQPAMSSFVFSKITNAFISLQRRQPHVLAEMVLSIYSDILNDLIKLDLRNIDTLLKCSCLALIEHAMMIDDGAPTKNAIIDFFTNLSNCSAISNSDAIRSILLSNLKLATDKHLAYFSNYYFRFVTRFAQINASLIDDLLAHLRDAIENVELMRGAGRDGNLRNFLHKLEQTVLSAQLII